MRPWPSAAEAGNSPCAFGTVKTVPFQHVQSGYATASKSERGKIEAEYHRMEPADLDERMSHAKRHSPGAIRLPPKLVENLQSLAEFEGEREYQAMVRRWIEERLQQETSAGQ